MLPNHTVNSGKGSLGKMKWKTRGGLMGTASGGQSLRHRYAVHAPKLQSPSQLLFATSAFLTLLRCSNYLNYAHYARVFPEM